MIIVSAALVSIGRLLAPYADAARPLVQDMLSEALQQPVRIREIRARWPRMSPEIRLLGLEVGPVDAPLLQIDQARLQLRLYNLLRPARNTVGLAALGLDIAAVQDPDGRWSWQLEQGGRVGRGWERALTAGDLTLRDVGIRVDARDLPPIRLRVPEAALARDGARIAANLLAIPEGLDGRKDPREDEPLGESIADSSSAVIDPSDDSSIVFFNDRSDDASNGSPGSASTAPSTGTPIEIGLRLDLPDSGLRAVRAHARIDELHLPPVDDASEGLHVAGELWLDWTLEAGLDARGDLDLERWLDGEVLERLALSLLAERRGEALTIDLEGRDPEQDEPWFDEAAIGRSPDHWALAAGRIDLERLHRWTAPLRQRTALPAFELAGTVRDLALGGDRNGHLHAVSGVIEEFDMALAMSERAAGPLVARVERLELGLDGDALVAHPDGVLGLDWPGLFDRPVRFDDVAGSVLLRPSSLEFRDLALDHPDLALAIDGGVFDSGDAVSDALFVDLVVDTPRISTDAPAGWIPRRGLPPRTRAWLVDALVKVERAEALTTLFGAPRTWKQGLADGGLNSRIAFRGLDLAYADGWPAGTGLDGRVEFLGESMSAVVDAGRIAGTALAGPRIEIPRLRQAELLLLLETAAGTTAGELIELVRALPLAAARPTLERLSVHGDAAATARVMLPVKRISDWQLEGEVVFDDARIDWPVPAYRVDALTGSVRFGRDGFGPSTLDGLRAGRPVDLEIAADFQPKFELRLGGKWPLAAAVPDDRPAALAPLLADASGASRFDVTIRGAADPGAPLSDSSSMVTSATTAASPSSSIATTTSGASPGPGVEGDGEDPSAGEADFGAAASVTVDSDLVGLALDWPAPLDKPAEARWPFRLEVLLDETAGPAPIRFDLVDRVEGLVRTGNPSTDNRGTGQLGLGLGEADATLPTAEAFRVVGDLDALDLSGWVGRLAAGGGTGGADDDTDGPTSDPGTLDGGVGGVIDTDAGVELALDAAVDGWLDVAIGDLCFDTASLGPVAVSLGRESDYWRLVLEGPALAGRFRLPADGNGSVVADLERLHWPRPADVERTPGRPSRIDPRDLPEIDVRIDDLRYGDLALGRLSVNTHAAARGLEIEQFSIEHPTLGLTGGGRWWRPADSDQPRTRGRFRMTADSLGQVLADAGYDIALQRGQSVVTLSGGWPGSPLDFTLERFEGQLDLAIGDGVIPEARVGAGRLLGLVSLNSIPRRLRMDFTDVFAEGLTFDRVAGHFELAQGRAMTDDLVIEAPAAIVQIRGETDLAERTYDQTLIVQPGVGSTLPIIGALTGGPIGAAAGAALQQLLDKPLRGISEVQYTVTGPWDDPLLVPVSARGVEGLPGTESAPDTAEGG